MARSWKPLRIFISSTFQDMQDERDELVKRVFPRIHYLCEQRGLNFTEIDLRWGITAEQAAEDRILPICFAEIERCRPYFLGVIGQRYGWVPESLPEEVLEEHPWLEEYEGRSITELEILHGSLRPDGSTHAFFYFREAPHPDVEQVADLKQRIRTSGAVVHEGYPDAETLGEWVERDLESLIEREYPESEMPDPLDRESAEHEAYAAERTALYVVEADRGDRLTAHVIQDGPPLMVTGEPGSGKSALLANWSLRHRSVRPRDVLIEHYIGATPFTSDLTATLGRILGEIRRRLEIDQETPESPEAIRSALPEWLLLAADALEQRDPGADSRLILVVDGLDHLEDRHGAADLVWSPLTLPHRVSLILSTRPGRPLEAAGELSWPSIEVAPLAADERARLIRAWLGRAGKTLGEPLGERIAGSPRAGNPLYLLTLLEELRVYGDYDTLERWIDTCLAATTTEGLFRVILRRYESDYERDRPHLVRDAMRAIWAARRGLSDAELLMLLGKDAEPAPHAPWSQLALVARHAIVDRSGLYGFSHDHLRSAVEQLYVPDEKEKRRSHRRLARHFANREFSGRALDELPWQLAEGAEWEQLRNLLVDPASLEALWRARDADVLTFWRRLEDASDLRLADAFADVIESPTRDVDHAERVALILEYAGLYPESQRLFRGLLGHYRAACDEERVAGALISIGQVIRSEQPQEALQLYAEAEEIARRLSLDKTLVSVLHSRGLVLRQVERNDAAVETFAELERVVERLDDEELKALTRFQRARRLMDEGDLDAAASLFEEVERHHRRHGRINALGMTLRNRADILARQGHHDAAMPLLEEQVAINRNLGLRAPLAEALCRLAEQKMPKLRVAEAREHLEEALRITRAKGLEVDHQVAEKRARKLADTSKAGAVELSSEDAAPIVAVLLDGAAGIYEAIGESAEADELRSRLRDTGWNPGEAAELLRNVNEQGETDMSKDPGEELSRRAVELMNSGEFAEALPLLREEEEICRSRGQARELVQCLCNQGLALLNIGQPEAALEILEQVRETARANDDKVMETLALLNSVSALWRMPGRRVEVVPLAKRASELADATGDEKLISTVTTTLRGIFAS
jgi:tetratricopeptide (TPR) repeat protein